MALSRNTKILIGAGAVVVIGVIVGVSVSQRAVLPEVQAAKVEKRAMLESKVTANGEIHPIQFISLQAEVPGRVTDVYVKEGDVVKKGVPLLRVDPTQIESATSVQEAGLRAMQSEVANQVSALTAAENAVSTALAALTTSQADMERANVERNNAQIELKRASDLLEDGIGSR
jgi:multidrug efflux pump subunit AcrA (membrane-fusion protein)